MAKPTKEPEWAVLDVNDPVTLAPNKLEPSTTKKNNGWAHLEKPPYNWFNYWQNLVYQWVKYIDDEALEGAFTFQGVKTFQDNIIAQGDVTISGGVAKFANGATITIASSNARQESQNGADVIIDTGSDAGVVINTWLTTLNGLGGGTLYLTEGDFNTATRIEIPGNILFKGQGHATKINQTANMTSIILVTGGNVDCRDFRIECDKATYTQGTGIDGGAGTNVVNRFTNIIVNNSYNIGFRDCRNLINCQAYNSRQQSFFNCYNLINCRGEDGGSDGFDDCDYLTMCVSDNHGGDGYTGCQHLNICQSINNTVNGYQQCQYFQGCYAEGNTINYSLCQYFSGGNISYNATGIGYNLCVELTACLSLSDGTNGFDSCTDLSSCRADQASANGFDDCNQLGQCRATNCTADGFQDCTQLVACKSNNNVNGYDGCNGMQQNTGSGNSGNRYNNCNADLSASTTYPIAVGGTDTPNGGFNS